MNKTYRGNEHLKAPNSVEWVNSNEQEYRIKEIIRSKSNIGYFAEKYFTIIGDGGEQIIKLYPKQKEFLQFLLDNKRICTVASRQSGKCHYKDTKIKIRNKHTGNIYEITAEEFHQLIKNSK